MTKYDRMHARKEARKAAREAERRGDAEKKEKQKKRATYRKDGQGNIILFGWLKVTWVAIAMIIGIVLITSFLAFALIMNDEEFRDENCKNPFCRLFIDTSDPNADMPFVPDVDAEWEEYYEDIVDTEKNIPMPPDEEPNWTLIPEAEARGEDEPVCYSPACKKKYAEEAEAEKVQGNPEYEAHQEIRETEMDRINDLIKELKEEIVTLEEDIDKLHDEIPQMEMDWKQQEKDEKSGDGKLKSMEYNLEKLKKEYRKAYDDSRTSGDLDDAKLLKEEYNAYKKLYEDELERYAEDTKKTIELETGYEEARDELEIMMEELRDMKDDLELLKIEMWKAKQSNQFISIRLSGTCIVLIENGYPSNCPTYAELKDTFDNTDPRISGGFSPSVSGNDIRRDVPPMENHWLYYEQLPNWKIITVDPHPYLMAKGMVIDVAPMTVKKVHLPSVAKDCDDPDKAEGCEYDVQYDVIIDKYCSHASVSPDMKSIGEGIKQLMKSCKYEGDDKLGLSWKKLITMPIYDPYRVYNPLWLDAIIDGALGK